MSLGGGAEGGGGLCRAAPTGDPPPISGPRIAARNLYRSQLTGRGPLTRPQGEIPGHISYSGSRPPAGPQPIPTRNPGDATVTLRQPPSTRAPPRMQNPEPPQPASDNQEKESGQSNYEDRRAEIPERSGTSNPGRTSGPQQPQSGGANKAARMPAKRIPRSSAPHHRRKGRYRGPG